MKAKDLFNTLHQMKHLDKDEFCSVILSNHVDDGFADTMFALMCFVDIFQDDKVGVRK